MKPAVSGYEVLGELGRGGMGVVYQARHLETGELVAIKVLHEGQIDDPVRVKRFRAECNVLSKLRHPNIVQLREIGGTDRRPCLVMELVTGGNLQRRLEGELESAETCAAFVEKLARSLHAVHTQQIVHRDLKPANVLLTAEGEPKVTDFGLAKLLDTEERMTSTGAVLGTPRYMAPEQAAGQTRLIGPATDVHALGLILYEMLTGERPFDAPTVVEVLEKVRTEDVRPPSRIRPVPRDLEVICLKCLHKEPAKRYASAAALADDLRRFLEHRPIKARPVGLWERAVKWRRRNRVLAALLFAAIGLGALGLGTGTWYWDAYKRPKIAYFADYVNRFGAPEGRGRLTETEVARRAVSYRFTTRGGRVEQVEVVNSRGVLTDFSQEQTILNRAAGEEKVCRYVYQRNGDGTPLEEVGYDRHGNQLWALHYTTPTTAHYRNVRGYPRARTGSGAAYVEFVWSSEGYEQEVHYLDRSGNPHPNDEGVYGLRRQFDAAGHTVRTTFLDASYQPTYNRKQRCSVTEIRRNEKGQETERTLFDTGGRPVVGADGFYRRTTILDDAGNVTEQAYFDPGDKPTYSKSSLAHRVHGRFDDRGFDVEWAFFDAMNRPVISKYGQARITATRDREGNMVETANYGTDENLIANQDGITRVTNRFDSRGLVLEKQFWDAAGRPANVDGYARLTRKYDDNGRILEEDLTDAAGNPVLSKDGYAGLRKVYDDRGNLIEQTHLGTDGRPIILKAGYARIRHVYDDRDNKVSTEYLDPAGHLVFGEKGYARITRKFDERGYETENAFFGPDNRPVNTKKYAAHRLVTRYDDRGNPIEITTFGTDGRPVTTTSGFTRTR